MIILRPHLFRRASKNSWGLKSYTPAALFLLSSPGLLSNLYTPAFLMYTFVSGMAV